MKFIGVIAFADSAERVNGNRMTNVMGFGVAAEWLKSVTEFYRGQVMVGDYDGSEIMIQIHHYSGPIGEFGQLDIDDFPFDTDTLLEAVSIMNPYYAL